MLTILIRFFFCYYCYYGLMSVLTCSMFLNYFIMIIKLFNLNLYFPFVSVAFITFIFENSFFYRMNMYGHVCMYDAMNREISAFKSRIEITNTGKHFAILKPVSTGEQILIYTSIKCDNEVNQNGRNVIMFIVLAIGKFSHYFHLRID